MGRVANILLARGLSVYDLSVMSGIKEGSLGRNIKTGKISKHENIEKIAKALGVTVESLKSENPVTGLKEFVFNSKINEVRIFDRIAAGSGTEIFDNPTDIINFSHPAINNLKGEIVGFNVKGDSMRPRITEGDIVICKLLNLPSEKPRDRDLIVTVFHNQTNFSEGNLKMFSWVDKNKGVFNLSSFNTYYTPKTFSLKDVRYFFRVYLVISKVDYK